MEHCTTRFFETCDLDNDKYIALDEWARCFGIKESECLSSGAAGPRLPPFASVICVSVLCPALLPAELTPVCSPCGVSLALSLLPDYWAGGRSLSPFLEH